MEIAPEERLHEQPRKRIRLSSPELPSGAESVPGACNGAALDAAVVDSQLDKETRAGITEFVNPDAPGFSGILKLRYTDFLVNEILSSGRVLHLQRPNGRLTERAGEGATETSTLPEESAQEPETIEITEASNAVAATSPADIISDEVKKSAEEVKTQISPEDEASLETIFGPKAAASIQSLHAKVLANPRKKAREFKSVASDPISDREQRTKAHQLIRRVFHSRLETNTQPDGSITILAAPPVTDGGRSRRNNPASRGKGKLAWEELGGEYLHFTLYKENKDTMEIVFYIASRLKLGTKHFQFAGTKDRRGVTVQRLSAYRVEAERLASIGKSLRSASIGDFEYCQTGLELGQLSGNEFVITLRDCHFPDKDGLEEHERVANAQALLNNVLKDFRHNGFINYFGLQRFGAFGTGTDAVGIKILQGDLKGAVNAILDFSPDALAAAQDPESTLRVSSEDKARAEALHIWKTTSDADSAIAKLPRKFSAETNLIRYLGFTNRKTGEQSRKSDYQGALQVIPRNLRLMYVHAYQSLVWNTVAGRRWTLFGPRVVAGDLVLIGEHKEKDPASDELASATVDEQGEPIVLPAASDSAADAPDAFVRARPLTDAEAQSGDYSIFDVVLPLPGFDVEYPPNAVGEFYTEFMGSERGGGLDPRDMRRAWKEASLSGGYRKLLARAGEDMTAEVRVYERDDEQLVETDLDRLEGRKLGAADTQGLPHAQADIGPKQDTASDAERDLQNQASPKKLAVILKMQLSSSQYATMALRELTKAGVKTHKSEYGGR